MNDFPEGWINRIDSGNHNYVNIVPQPGKDVTAKYFDNKAIYLPSESQLYEEQALRHGSNVIWLGVTGWTSVPKDFPSRFGTHIELYQKAVTALIIETSECLADAGIKVDLRHGASNAGVDGASLSAMELAGISGSGVNCPKFMLWVDDDTRGGPVYVAADKQAYHEAFARYSQVLLVTGGKNDAYKHDYLKRVGSSGFSVVADLIQVLSERPVLGSEYLPLIAEPQIIDAARYIVEVNSFLISPPKSFDELLATTKFLVLTDAYKVLRMAPDQGRLDGLLDQVSLHQAAPKPPVITAKELDQRISLALQS